MQTSCQRMFECTMALAVTAWRAAARPWQTSGESSWSSSSSWCPSATTMWHSLKLPWQSPSGVPLAFTGTISTFNLKLPPTIACLLPSSWVFCGGLGVLSYKTWCQCIWWYDTSTSNRIFSLIPHVPCHRSSSQTFHITLKWLQMLLNTFGPFHTSESFWTTSFSFPDNSSIT